MNTLDTRLLGVDDSGITQAEDPTVSYFYHPVKAELGSGPLPYMAWVHKSRTQHRSLNYIFPYFQDYLVYDEAGNVDRAKSSIQRLLNEIASLAPTRRVTLASHRFWEIQPSPRPGFSNGIVVSLTATFYSGVV